jgi:hypothetical protein
MMFGWSLSSAEQMARRYTHLDPTMLKDFLKLCGFDGNDSLNKTN